MWAWLLRGMASSWECWLLVGAVGVAVVVCVGWLCHWLNTCGRGRAGLCENDTCRCLHDEWLVSSFHGVGTLCLASAGITVGQCPTACQLMIMSCLVCNLTAFATKP
jgi:hypothetical protein